MSKIEEMADERYPLRRIDIDMRIADYCQRMAFLAGARAVLEEARRMAHRPMGLFGVEPWEVVMLEHLEALFTEDHEQQA